MLALEAPVEIMNTTSAYVGRRFCTSCMRPWGDMDTYLDCAALAAEAALIAALPRDAEGNPIGLESLEVPDRAQIFMKSPLRKFYGACCVRALFPVQHNIRDEPANATILVSSSFVGQFPSAFTIDCLRTLPAQIGEVDTSEVFLEPTSLDIAEKAL